MPTKKPSRLVASLRKRLATANERRVYFQDLNKKHVALLREAEQYSADALASVNAELLKSREEIAREKATVATLMTAVDKAGDREAYQLAANRQLRQLLDAWLMRFARTRDGMLVAKTRRTLGQV